MSSNGQKEFAELQRTLRYAMEHGKAPPLPLWERTIEFIEESNADRAPFFAIMLVLASALLGFAIAVSP